MRTLLVDNHDSYTYNVFHLLAAASGEEPTVVNNDAVSWRYPDLWDDGADIGELVYSVGGTAGQERFRIYRVFSRPGSSAPRLPR